MIAALLARTLAAPLGGRARAVAPDAPEARDVIVVLGARLGRDGGLTAVLAERVAAGAALYHAGAAPRVVATGGVTAGAPRAEADAMADALRVAGVPEAAIVVERAAQTTADNARLVAALLRRGARAWLVTQPFHAPRAVHLFTRAGLDARAWPLPDSLQYTDARRELRWLAREYAAWAGLLLGRPWSRRA